MPSPSPAADTQKPRSPILAAPGCFILCLGALLVCGGLLWAGYTFLRQVREMAAFTSPEPVALPVESPEPAAVAALEEKFNDFARRVEAGEGPALSLSTEELNTMLAGFSRFESIKLLFVVQKVDPDRISALVSLPMNTMPGRRAFLNGTIHFIPTANGQIGLHLRTESIEVPGKTVPKGFLEIYQEGVIPGKTAGFLDDMLVRNFRGDRAVGRFLRKIESVSLAENQITLQASKGPPKTENE